MSPDNTLAPIPHQDQVARRLARFWARVRRGDGCWEWIGPRLPSGYGTHGGGKDRYYAHRFSYELHHGPIPDGLFVLHRCDNPSCVNPAHLFVGTQKDNIADMWEKGRGKRHGQKGESNIKAKLTPSQVVEIRRRYAQGGAGYTALSRLFGVHRSLIRNIVKGKIWRHLPI